MRDGQRAHGLSLDAQLGGNQLHADGALGGERDSLRFSLARPGWNSWAAACRRAASARASYCQGWLRLTRIARPPTARARRRQRDSLQLQARLPDDFNLPGEATLEGGNCAPPVGKSAARKARYQGQRTRHTLNASARR